MYFQRRGSNYSFIYYDASLKKNVRLTQDKIPRIKNDEEADQFCKKFDKKHGTPKTRYEKIISPWASKFNDWAILAKLFKTVRQSEAPNSWDSEVFYLESYIFPFFLVLKKALNIDLWEALLEDFRDHLLEVVSVRYRKPIAYSTRNNIICSLNAFLLMMYRRRKLARICVCRGYGNHLLVQRGVESLIPEDHQRAIFSAIRTVSTEAAFYFWISLNTGLRINELLGLSMGDLYLGEVDSPSLNLPLQACSLTYQGFLALESQPAYSNRIRAKDGTVPRRPLKGKKKIDYRSSRVIPVFDPESLRYLVELRNHQFNLYQEQRYGTNPKDYLLFENLSKTRVTRFLREAQERLKIKQVFTPHDTRHTYSTWLANRTGGNFSVCQMILGHGDPKTTLRYIHVNAQLHRNLKIETQLSGPLRIEGETKNLTLPLDFKKTGDLKRLWLYKA